MSIAGCCRSCYKSIVTCLSACCGCDGDQDEGAATSSYAMSDHVVPPHADQPPATVVLHSSFNATHAFSSEGTLSDLPSNFEHNYNPPGTPTEASYHDSSEAVGNHHRPTTHIQTTPEESYTTLQLPPTYDPERYTTLPATSYV